MYKLGRNHICLHCILISDGRCEKIRDYSKKNIQNKGFSESIYHIVVYYTVIFFKLRFLRSSQEPCRAIVFHGGTTGGAHQHWISFEHAYNFKFKQAF